MELHDVLPTAAPAYISQRCSCYFCQPFFLYLYIALTGKEPRVMHISDLSLSVSEISWTVAQANRGVKAVFSLETGETETNYSDDSHIYKGGRL